ncbi:polysaccharide biosynthesis/export family protein [Stigmatella aurantiaca]|uniref:Polysaccharide biosynthesis/export protein n=1 Tax=Stigmatella aurantiaca (strain DW4/3-1) TaxID=378806 RepID=E3FKW6_STIAD|nr:polysaccharide biosynthesis/export family protein [Stigmatella aurantiaca]ADO70484.1 Polysaccharide biosynthesis/export protein [Stigmatella aurantiaca DW4/3-1]
MRLCPALLLSLVLATVLACRSAAPVPNLPLPSEQEARRAASASNTLGAGDVVEVRVFQEPDHSGIWRVSPEGTIDYPLCGKVTLEGRTSSTAADVLRECLARYLRNPQVAVLIREYNSKKIFVFGEVQKPGTFPYDGEMTIIQAITLAGGFTKLAAKNSTNVTRRVDGQERKIRVPVEDIGVGREKNFLLQPGDIIFIPESFF